MHIDDLPESAVYIAALRQRLPENTLRHTLSVTEYLLEIAEIAGVDPMRAATAGLLHDYSKKLHRHELLELAERYGIEIGDLHRDQAKLLHGPVAAAEVRARFGIEDEEVLDAIRWHTTGKPGLGAIGLALYYADFSEPLRTHPEAAEAREILAQEGYRAALRYVSKTKCEHVETQEVFDPTTRAFDDWLQREMA